MRARSCLWFLPSFSPFFLFFSFFSPASFRRLGHAALARVKELQKYLAKRESDARGRFSFSFFFFSPSANCLERCMLNSRTIRGYVRKREHARVANATRNCKNWDRYCGKLDLYETRIFCVEERKEMNLQRHNCDLFGIGSVKTQSTFEMMYQDDYIIIIVIVRIYNYNCKNLVRHQ